MRTWKKGISPLIASVLLIAFTMAIAGIMATWTTTFSREKLTSASEESDCIGALDLSSPKFENSVVSVRIRNVGTSINLTGFKATLEYNDVSLNKEYDLKNYGVKDPLAPSETSFVTINTTTPAKPTQIEVISTNCAKQPSLLFFK